MTGLLIAEREQCRAWTAFQEASYGADTRFRLRAVIINSNLES
jgi:hypothetical protein